MAKQVKRGVNIYVDQTQAEKALEALQVKFAMLEKSMQSLEKEGKKGTAVWDVTERRINSVKTQLDGLTKTFGINELSQRQLYALQAKYQNLLHNANPQTAKYKEYEKVLGVVKIRLDELKNGSISTEKAIEKLDNTTKVHQSSLGRLADKFNKYQSLVFGFVASITGVIFSIKSLIKQYAELEDKFADVRKTTGLTIEQVKKLDESLKKYDTRTSREELLMLARDAGKLGITGKKNIEEFVKSADKIRVALGEDLGEDAIQNIGKIADVFGLVKEMGFGDSLNAIGSAINDLGQASTANETFLVEFTHRMGGVAAQANISVQNILGFASALDQAGQNVEMSATAVQQFLMKMLAEPAKFAKIAGLEVQSFTKLVATDTNQALIQMLKAMNEKGGFQALIPMFKDMGADGARAVSVLSTLAKKIDNVTEAQKLSNDSFSKGTSLTNEFNIKNETAQAKLDKAKKKFAETAVELGEKLYPAITISTNGLSYLIKGISLLIKNFDVIKPYIAASVILFIALNKQMLYNITLGEKGLVTKSIELAQKIKDIFLTKQQIIVQELQNATMFKGSVISKSLAIGVRLVSMAFSSWMGIGIVIAGVVTALAIFNQKNKQAAAEQKRLSEERINAELEHKKAIDDSYSSQISLYKKLQAEWNLLGDSLDKKKAFIKNNQEAFNQLGLSIKSVSEAENAYVADEDKVIKSMMNRAIIAANEGEMNKIAAKIATSKRVYDQAEANYKLTQGTYKNDQGGDMTNPAVNPYAGVANQKISDSKAKLTKAKKDYDKLNSDWRAFFNENKRIADDLIKNGFTTTPTTTEPTTPTTPFVDPDKSARERKEAMDKEIKALEDKTKQEKAILKKSLLENNTTEEYYNSENIKKDISFNEEKIQILKRYGELTGDAELDLLNAQAAQSDNKEKNKKADFEKEIKALEDNHKLGLDELDKQLKEKSIIQKDYDILMLAAEISLAEKKLEVQRQYGEDTKDILLDIGNKKRELTKKIIEKEDKGKSNLEKLDLEAKQTLLAYQKGILNKQEYEDKILEIATKRVDEELKQHMRLAENINKLSADGLQAASNFKEVSLTNSETNYNKEVTALDDKLKREIITQEEYDSQKKNLETKYQEEQKAIKKKYAGIELALNIAQIISSTGLAVMNSIKMGLPWSIPFGVMAGLQGASQLALAVAQYNQIQGLEDGLYPKVTRRQDGKQFNVSHVGEVSTGVYGKPSVLVGEAGPELVVDNRRFRKIMRDNPQVIDYIVNGYEGGKYPMLSNKAINAGSQSNSLIEQNTKIMNKLMMVLNSSSIYSFRDKLNQADRTIDKINNKFK